MLNFEILETSVQDYIIENSGANIPQLALKGSPFKKVKTAELMQQIESKTKCKKKLPTWYQTPHILYPNKLNIEQSSSEITAAYKSHIVSGQTLLDLTGGLGVDSYYFSKTMHRVIHCEINKTLSEIAAYNFSAMQVSKIKTKAKDGLSFLAQTSGFFDWIYLDPSRRDKTKKKCFLIEDCRPNILNNLELFFSRSKNILIKLSPMLDIVAALKILPNTKEVHIVAVKNEVKELLFNLEKGFVKEAEIKAINLESSQRVFKFKISEEKTATISCLEPLNYLFEPNVSVLKSGGFKSIAQKFDLKKLAINTHLYTGSKILTDFPGIIYKIEKNLPYKKQEIKQLLSGLKANIKSRNFPKSVEEIKKSYNFKDGGEKYVFFTETAQQKCALICSKLSVGD